MELKLENGDYVPDGKGGHVRLGGAEEVLARVLFRLTARRGAVPFLPALPRGGRASPYLEIRCRRGRRPEPRPAF